ncbi:MAG: DUF1499 domain-containing protein [Pseudomonadota bacterium]
MKLLTVALWIAFALVAVTFVAGQLGLLSGRQPTDLGVRDGRLKPPSRTPNSVSSQAHLYPDAPQRDDAAIAPLKFTGDPAAAIARVRRIVESMPGARVVDARSDYLYAQFTTRWLKFVDDVEFWAAPAEGAIHVRSASRVGRRDFGVNRKRVEAIRAAYQRQ